MSDVVMAGSSGPGDDVDPALAAALAGFDASFVRRASRRALWRTGAVAGTAAVFWTALAVAVALIGSAAWVRGAGLKAGFVRVAQSGLAAARPDLVATKVDCCKTGVGLNASERFDLRVRRADGLGDSLVVHLHQDWRGRYHRVPARSGTPVLDALAAGRPAKAATKALLDGLAPASTGLAIVEVDTPVPTVPSSISVGTALLTDPYAKGPMLAWPVEDLDSFAGWAARLRRSDGANLARLGLPTPSAIQAIAQKPRVFAVIVDRSTLSNLRQWLADPIVRSVNIADVAADLRIQHSAVTS